MKFMDVFSLEILTQFISMFTVFKMEDINSKEQ